MFENELKNLQNKEHLSDDSPLIEDLKNVLDILVNKDYTLTDISEEIENGKININSDPKTLLVYLNQILTDNYRSNKKVNISIYKDAQESYLNHTSFIMYQFKDYSKESYGLNLDASIALKMMLEEGYNIDLIELIIKKYSIVPNITKDYLDSIREGLIKTEEQYNKIMEIDLDKKYSNVIDIYRFFVKKHLQSSNEKILSSQEELKIISKLYRALIKSYEKGITSSDNTDIYNWQKDNETIILPILKDILNECSPIATEPGRNKEQYIESLILNLQDIFCKINTNEENILIYDEDYNKNLLNRQTELVYGEQIEIVDDCMVAKNLIEKHKNLEGIRKTIATQSKIANSQNNPYNTSNEYANWVVDCAKLSIDCELNIVNTQLDFKFKEINSYQELKKYGISAKILYFKALLDRISIYPSFVFKLSERDTDIDACERIMTQYKDIDILELKSVLLEYSPRAKLAGIKKEYENRVINAVIERINAVKEYHLKQSLLVKEYREKRGLATEGILHTIAMSSIKDCKTAVDLFQKNYNSQEITKVIEDTVNDFHIEAPKIYANNIANSAKKLLERWEFIKEYTPNAISSDVVNDYLLCLKTIYKNSQYPTPENDIQATKQLINSGKYTAFDILYAIRDYSPNAVEAGRDSNYKEYVFHSANKSIELKNNRLQNNKISKQNTILSPPEHIRVRSLNNE